MAQSRCSSAPICPNPLKGTSRTLRVPHFAGVMSLCEVGKSGESHLRRSLRRRDGGLYRQSDQLLNGCDGL